MNKWGMTIGDWIEKQIAEAYEEEQEAIKEAARKARERLDEEGK